MAWFDTFDRLMEEKSGAVRVEKDADMAKYTSFRIGGPAKRMVFPHKEEDVALILESCKAAEISWFVLGRGSNLLVSDQGLDCVVLNMAELNGIRLEENDIVYAQAGALLSRIAVQAQQAGLAGLAFAHGIPGSLGGAVVMNAGAYGGEMRQVVKEVTALFADGVRTLEAKDLHFSYRHSIFNEEEGIVLSARLMLQPGDSEQIRAEMDDLMVRRKASQPLEYPSAGSTFKRPEGHFAGTMIDECGLKGTAVGGAEVSAKHAGFIINKGNATFADVVSLIGVVQDTVYRTFGVELEPEVRIIQSAEKSEEQL